ncbi:hypothetical protein [Streptomyces griseocarneus]|uniref:hypothetical protein n=1 Tax=Streptomyces griseocarneus TaxID=51201 RepID=UPI00325B9239
MSAPASVPIRSRRPFARVLLPVAPGLLLTLLALAGPLFAPHPIGTPVTAPTPRPARTRFWAATSSAGTC